MTDAAAIVQIADSNEIKFYSLPELRPVLEFMRVGPVHLKKFTASVTLDRLPYDKDIYALARIIKNDWGKVEAGWYKFVRSEKT